MNTYTVGTTVTLRAEFALADGTLVDPSEVTCEVLLPDGTVETLDDVIHESTGVYTADFPITMNGLHEFRIAGTGTIASANEDFFMAQTVFPTE